MSERHTEADFGSAITPASVTATSRSGGRRSIFITGAARGIGRAACELFAAQGWYVGAFDLQSSGPQLLELVKMLGHGNCVAGSLDVTDAAAVQRAVVLFGERTGFTMDLLFNNAGIAVGGGFGDLSHAQHAQQVAVNCMGVVNGAHAALPLLKNTPGSVRMAHMRRCPACILCAVWVLKLACHRGSRSQLLLNTASSASIMGAPGLATYGATKGFVRLLTEGLSAELGGGDHPVRVADVLPGFITTDMNPADRPGPAGIGPFRESLCPVPLLLLL